MITKFKIFESTQKKFWLVRCDNIPYLEASLDKIDCTEDEIFYFLNIVRDNRNEIGDKIYINRNAPDDECGYMKKNYDYDDDDEDYGYDWYESHNYIYMGEVTVTPEELEKYILKHNANVYNL